MDEIQTLFEQALNQVPRLILEQRLPHILKRAGIPVTNASIKLLADHILSANEGRVHIEGVGDDATIEITDEDTAHIIGTVDRFVNEQLEGVVSKMAKDVADVLLKTLRKRWPAEFEAQQADKHFQDVGHACVVHAERAALLVLRDGLNHRTEDVGIDLLPVEIADMDEVRPRDLAKSRYIQTA